MNVRTNEQSRAGEEREREEKRKYITWRRTIANPNYNRHSRNLVRFLHPRRVSPSSSLSLYPFLLFFLVSFFFAARALLAPFRFSTRINAPDRHEKRTNTSPLMTKFISCLIKTAPNKTKQSKKNNKRRNVLATFQCSSRLASCWSLRADRLASELPSASCVWSNQLIGSLISYSLCLFIWDEDFLAQCLRLYGQVTPVCWRRKNSRNCYSIVTERKKQHAHSRL